MFKKGVSGNPRGKPPGARSKALLALDAIGEARAKDLIAAAIKQALGGNARALQILLDRVWPVRKGGAPISIQLPQMESVTDLPAVLAALTAATTNGQLNAEEAAGIANIIDVYRRGVETAELEARIAALEAGMPQPQSEPDE